MPTPVWHTHTHTRTEIFSVKFVAFTWFALSRKIQTHTHTHTSFWRHSKFWQLTNFVAKVWHMFAIDRELCLAQKQDMFSREKGNTAEEWATKLSEAFVHARQRWETANCKQLHFATRFPIFCLLLLKLLLTFRLLSKLIKSILPLPSRLHLPAIELAAGTPCRLCSGILVKDIALITAFDRITGWFLAISPVSCLRNCTTWALEIIIQAKIKPSG